MKRIAILGSTGSIGCNTLEVIRDHPDRFRVAALSAHSNIRLLASQAGEFKPDFVCVTGPDDAVSRGYFGPEAKVFRGFSGLSEMLESPKIDMVVLAISGSGALLPLWKAIEQKKEIATANKEALVMAGPLINRLARKNKVRILPIDSEQSAIWQCLEGQDRKKLQKIYLTASGGPFRGFTSAQMKRIGLKDALAHPRWKMGRKITIDSATLMNKGLEILEAMCLFEVPPDKIEVLIHPESIIHSMVEFVDGAVMAQLSVTDMRIPIQYAMSYPERLGSSIRRLDFPGIGSLNFCRPDYKKFPCLSLAFEAARRSGTMPAVLNAANEINVDAFIRGRIAFAEIPEVNAKVMRKHSPLSDPSIEDIFEADSWAKNEAGKIIGRKG